MAGPLKIKDLPLDARPREAFMRSAEPDREIPDASLLAILIRTGRKGSSAIDLAHRLINHFGGAANLIDATWQQIVAAKVPGVGKVAAVQLAAAFALVKRNARTSHRSFARAIETSDDVVRQVESVGIDETQESAFALYLDAKRHLLCEPVRVSHPHRLRDSYVDWLFLYLHSGVGRKLLSLSKRRYGNSLDKFEPNDLNGALVPTRDYFDSLGCDKLAKLMGVVKSGVDPVRQLDEVFAQLLDGDGDEECAHCVTYSFRRPRAEQLRLAIEKKRGYKGTAAGKAKSAGKTATKKNGAKKLAAKRPKSVRARYGKRG